MNGIISAYYLWKNTKSHQMEWAMCNKDNKQSSFDKFG